MSATLKRTNLRSYRLLDQLGFAPAAEDLYPEYGVLPDELLMLRKAVVA